jgi:D-amino-acid oxidase
VVDALVIGAGVCGLTAAVALAEQGMDVVVRAQAVRERTTSWAAGAIWGPLDSHQSETLRWSEATLHVLLGLLREDVGVRQAYGLEACREHVDPPYFLTNTEVKLASLGELPDGFVSGWRYAAPLVNMPVYISYLHARLEAAGGRIEHGHVARLRDAPPSRVLVNCSGAEARSLVPDDAVTAVRGQLVVVANPGIDEFFAEFLGDQVNLTYIFPIDGDQVVLGSTFEEYGTRTDHDPVIAKEIIDRCARIDGRLSDTRVLDHRVGFRCIRNGGVRLEHELLDGRDVIHNYGHGSGGVSLSWGCAADVALLAARVLA